MDQGYRRHLELFNLAAPGADTNFGAWSPDRESAARVTVALAVASVLYVVCVKDSTTHRWALNGGAALADEALYTFTFDVDPGASYAFQIGTDGVVEQLVVGEVFGGVI